VSERSNTLFLKILKLTSEGKVPEDPLLKRKKKKQASSGVAGGSAGKNNPLGSK